MQSVEIQRTTTALIPLTRGLFAVVSPEDADRISAFKWHAVKAGKAGHTNYAAGRSGSKMLYMHRVILGVENQGRELFVDHINHDGLDNRRENLRTCTPAQNARNRRFKPTFLGLTGVKREGAGWSAHIGVKGKLVYLGSFETEREAGIAYFAAHRACLALTF